MFRSMTIIRSSYLSLAKVTIVKSSVKIRRYKLCSGVAAYNVKFILVCMQCVVQNETAYTLHTHQHTGCFNDFRT